MTNNLTVPSIVKDFKSIRLEFTSMPHAPEEKKKWKKAPTYEEVINEAIQRKDWFSAFSNAVAYFEHWRYWRLTSYCMKEKIHAKEKIKSLSPANLTLILYLLKLVNQDTFSKMTKTILERNKLVHPISRGKGISYRDRKETDRAIEILDDAKVCIKRLKEGIISTYRQSNR
jgi:hypothetical protein